MSKKRYTVMIDDNFHYMDEELRDMLKQGVRPEELSSTWSLYGSDPFIMGGSSRFSARDYVTEKIQD